MRRWAPLLLILTALAGPARAERILSFDTRVELVPDGSFSVTEKIRYDFEGARRHGIQRDLPVRYGRGRAADYRIAVDRVHVTDANGERRPTKLMKKGRNLRIRIGSARRTVSGVQEYWIHYRVRRGILWFEDHDEIYWNATGTEWTVPIDRATAQVVLPVGGDDLEVETLCFTGRMGSVRQDCEDVRRGDEIHFEAAGGLRAREGLSVAVSLPKGVLLEPSALRKFLDRAGDYLSGWTLLPFVTLGLMSWLWRTTGRDPDPSPSIAVQYAPPEGLTPAEVGMIVDESADTWDVTASILDLAIRGFLRIRVIESEKFLFLSATDYELQKLPVDPAETERLKLHERKLLDALFATEDTVKVSSLKNEFHEDLKSIVSALRTEVCTRGGHFPSRPNSVRTWYAVFGVLAIGLGFLAGIKMGMGVTTLLGLGLSGVVLLAFSRFMPRKTKKGRRAYEHILGFREFVEKVDRDRLERMGGRTADNFERVLPYAIVLRVADPWADAFEDIYTEPPQWYVGPYAHGSFRPRSFVEDVGHSLKSMGGTFASKPSSSGSGSSGFSGGGFSGGGFGGGGGSSW